VVKYSESLIHKLEESLKNSFNQPLLRLTRQSGRPGSEIRITLSDGPRIAQSDDGPEISVVEILTADHHRSTFWFGFVGVFTVVELNKYDLFHTSLLVFHDIYGELVPLFRAEWDRDAAASEASKHAQPHWHFIQNPGRIERLIRTLTGPPHDAIGEFVPDEEAGLFHGIADCGRIHFAMTSLWEKSEVPSYTKRQFDSTDFPKWFQNLTGYIAGQIAYLVRHMPQTATPAARAFVPGEAERQE
jgi:hypothetical protein